MKPFAHVTGSAFFTLAIAAATLFFPLSRAFAQATKIFVASTGNDASDGSRGSPKRTFQAAHDAVAAGGQIVVLDTSGYGPLNITKSLAVTVPPGVNGFVTVTGNSNGITVNAAGNDKVSLRGLIVEGGGTGVGIGVLINSAGTVRVEDCTMRNFESGIEGLYSANSALVVRNCRVSDTSSQGIVVFANAPNLTINASVSDCALDRAGNAIAVSNQNQPGSIIKLTANHCTITNCLAGLDVNNNGSILIADTCTVRSTTFALFAAGGQIVASNCTIAGNTNGISNSNGTIITRGNNTFTNNTTDGSFSSSLAAK